MFCSATDPRVSGTQNFNKRAVSFSSGSQEGEDGSVRDLVSTLPSPSLFASGQQGPVRGRDAFSRIPCPTMEPGQCHTTHSDPTSRRTAFRVGPLCSISLPHRGYVSDSPGPACTVPGGLARAPQAVSLAPEDYQTRLSDSVRPASPQVQGHSVHLSVEQGCPCLACRSRGPTGEGRDRAGPSSRDEVRVLQPLLHRTQEDGGLRPILDLRVLNRALHKLPFRMLTQRRIFQCVRPFDWFAAIDLKDAYFHVSILPRHRPFLRFAFEGRAYQYKALPFGLSLSPRVFTKVVEAALVPLREAGIRILNYLDDWLILAQSRALLCEHRDMVLSHLSRLGLQVNREKSKLSPAQRISFLGMELDSVNLTARLSEERAQSMLRCLESLQRKRAVPLKHFQRLLGHMASSAAITPLGLLHMRPLQRWLHDRVPRWAWRHGTYRVSLTPSCRRTFSPWSDLAFLQAGVPLEQVSRHVVVSTDASATGWGAMCNGHAAAGLWTGPQLQWHINCLELLAVWLALHRFRTLLHEKHILVRSDNTATVAYINHQGGLRSRRMSQLSRHLLLWSQKHLRSLRAVHVPGELNRAADEFSRQHAPSGRMATPPQGTPADLETLRGRSGRPVCLPGHVSLPVVFLPVRGDPRYGCAGMQLASGLTQICVSPSEPSRTDPVQGQGGRGASPLGGALLAHSDLVPRTNAPRDSPSLANSSEEGSTFSERGHPLAPAPRLVEPPRMVLGRDAEVLSGLPPAVVNTITSARALSTRQAYRLKWNLFVNWCSPPPGGPP